MIYLFNNKKELTKIIPRGNLIGAIQELEINGLYLAEVEVPLFFKTEQGQVYNHKKSFDSAAFFGFFDLKKKFQLYKIHTRKVDGRTLTVSGVHLFFDEAKAMNVIRDKRLVDVDAQSATNTAFSGTGWTVKSSDITSLKSLDFYYETPQDARKSIIEMWNIEFDYDLGFDGRKITSKNMYIKKKLGQWTGDRYAYGTNILSIVQEQDEAEVFTAAIGRGTADDTNTALNSKVLFDDLVWSKDGYTKPVGQDYIEIVSATQQYGYYDAAGNVKPRIAIVDFDDEQDQQVLADKTYEWLKQNCVPKVSYKTTIAKSGDYYLGDEIGIIYKEIDIVKKARVEKIRVNLLNPKLSELGLGDYSFFKQDRFKKNVKNDIATVKKDTLTGLQKLRQDFSDSFDTQKQDIDAQIQQVKINAQAQVTAAETRMRGELDGAQSTLSTDITASYNNAVSAAETKAKALDAAVSQEIVNAKATLSTDINNSYTKAVADAETKAKALDASITQTVNANKQAADKTMSDLNTALNSTNNKVGTIEQNVTAVQDNISTLTSTTETQQEAINQAKQDISGLTSTVGGHTSDISTLNNQIVLKASKTEVTDAINGIVVGGVNLIRNSNYEYPQPPREYLQTVDLAPIFESYPLSQKYSLSMDIKSPVAGEVQVYMQNGSGTKYNFVREPVQVTTEWQRFKFEGLSPTLSKTTETKAILAFYGTYDSGRFPIVRNIQLELGTKATPYDISPIDRDVIISKNTAAITVANDEITKRVTKTEYDTRTGQIEQTANTAKSTADRNTQTITTVKGNVDSLTQWKADKGTAIDQTIDSVSTKAWLTDVNPITKRVETAEASISTNANEIIKRVTKTEFDSTTGRIEGVANTAKSTADSNSTAITTVSGKVGALEQWRTDKGSKIDQTIDAVSTKVWTNDIDALKYSSANLLLDSAKERTNAGATNQEFLDTGIDLSPIFDEYGINQDYTISFDMKSANVTNKNTVAVYPYPSNPNINKYLFPYTSFTITTDYKRYSFTFKPTLNDATKTWTKIVAFGTYNTGNAPFIKNVKVELGTKATPYVPHYKDAENRMTEINQTADSALTKSTAIGNDYVKQSAVLVQPDGVLIGSKKVSGTEMASAISVTPSNVDIITKVMRVTGDMAVAGDIKSLSLSAVNADIANLKAKIITTDSVTSTALKVDTALIQKLNTNALLTNYLTADTAMIGSIKSNALTAVRADIAWLKANVITADSITSTALKVDTALIDKLNANSLLTNKLIADTAMINAIKSNSITATRGDIAWLKSNIITADSIDATALKVDQALIDKLLVNDLLANSITAKSAFINNIKAIDIDLNRASIRGAIGTNYLQLTADELTQYGTYTRTWRGVTSTENVFTRFKNGYVRFRNNDKNRSLYMSEFGISTYVDGEGEGGGSSGTIQWWDPKYSPTNAFGITVNSYGGVAALTSDTNRTMIDSYLSVNLESTTAPINFKPEKNNSGNNSFQLSIVDAAHPTDTDGFLMYGSEVNGWGAGLRFSKSAAEQTVYVVNGNKERGGNATLDAGIVKANDVQTRSGSYSVYWNGSSGGTTGGESGVQNLYATGIKTRGTDSDMFLATQNGGWVRVTDGYGYNSGKGITYRGIAVSEYKTMSHHSLKHEITEWDYDVLEVIKNEWITYQYKLKNDPSGEFKRGTVVGGGYSTIPELVDSEGVKMYEMATWSMEAIKQLIFKVEALEEKINQK